MIKKNYNEKKIIVMKIIQILWFLYLRVYCFTIMTISYFGLFENTLLSFMLLLIYLLGLVWGWGQTKSLYLNIKRMMIKKKTE